jgi:hypothetical protein
MAHDIIPPHLAIKAMRSSGYRDAAHAVAELIDNSIQAGLKVQKKTSVEVLCVDRTEMVESRRRRRIYQIGVYDNASGMDADVLRMALQFGNGTHIEEDSQEGIGKFGMGLPNASISQCRRVDAWTWQDGRVLHTYLDIDEIEACTLKEVPQPKKAKLPNEWLTLIRSKVGDQGTLVVWSKLDRVTWKGSRAFLDNAAFLVGRMYRYFIADGSAVIRLAAFEEGSPKPISDRDVRPNDPLYLMKDTSAPTPYDATPAFDAFGDPIEHPIQIGRKKHIVTLKFSIAKPKARDVGGAAAIGKDAAKNQGISVVRARRELELNNTFDNHYDPRERWWGAEISFGPALDDLFGVTNNKQAATFFAYRDLDEDARLEGMTPQEYKDALAEANDPRLHIYELSSIIYAKLRTVRDQIKRMEIGTRKTKDGLPGRGSAEDIATRVTRQRREKMGDKGLSDKDEKLPAKKREEDLAEELEAEGMSRGDAKARAGDYVKSNLKFLFQEAEVPGGAVFDVRSKAGVLIININTKHPAHEHLFELLREEEGAEENSPALKALKLLLTAWARLEDEAGDERRQELEDTRSDWGRIARDFLKAVNG